MSTEKTLTEGTKNPARYREMSVPHESDDALQDAMKAFHADVDAGSSLWLDYLWCMLGSPLLVCGHMHRAVQGEGYRMLNINELTVLDIPNRER